MPRFHRRHQRGNRSAGYGMVIGAFIGAVTAFAARLLGLLGGLGRA